jgi:hypothetical protein
MDDRQEKKIYWNLKEKALNRNVWGPRFRRGYGPVARGTIKLIRL